MGELFDGVFSKFHAEESGEFENVVRFSGEKRPAFGDASGAAEFGEGLRSVAFRVEGDEDEADVGPDVVGKSVFDFAHVVGEDGASGDAVGEEHGDDLRPTGQRCELDLFVLVGGPVGIELVEGGVGDRMRWFEFFGAARRAGRGVFFGARHFLR